MKEGERGEGRGREGGVVFRKLSVEVGVSMNKREGR